MRQPNHTLSSPARAPNAGKTLAQRVAHPDTPVPPGQGLLARVTFGEPPADTAPCDFPCALLPVLPADACEDWLLPAADAEVGSHGPVRWSRVGGFVFAQVSAPLPTGADASAVTRDIYLELLRFQAAGEHPHLLRFWNFVPHINSGVGDEETYKRFCAGRLHAFREMAVTEAHFPAASAVGHAGSELVVQMLASDIPGEHHGNNKQVHAFEYPRQYGIASPSFARATSVDCGRRRLLFVSGTASIVGHATRFPHQLQGQLEVTIDNVSHLLEQTGTRADQMACMRVYLRNPADRASVAQALDAAFPAAQKNYVQADICRSDLLFEVECFCR
ncbi:hypothetical protein E4634_14160 [Mangrovimicrobium sediminis]|uniref:Chorismatase FkbO/Hyg5-like N-terminal domain-containing protein n=1 Tax=Mangrovimicrobium sediminis TaxID=2562682 RepID=A0A4Z0LZG6_9GAMM|nr:Rid family hydrolase [Haliea sp. SAOS-164]TGD72661.1 hypothetical protein E4634_14160 [Haliea sp. SAOS-164]